MYGYILLHLHFRFLKIYRKQIMDKPVKACSFLVAQDGKNMQSVINRPNILAVHLLWYYKFGKTMNQPSFSLKEQLNKAILIAIEAHTGQLDTNNGRPYIEHPFRVMNAGQTLPEKIVGILHDVVEDTPWTLDDLARAGFAKEILQAIDALTRHDDETYDEYLQRVKPIPLAVRVKLNDLSDNMDIRRWDGISDFELTRLRKYLKAYKELTEII